MSNDIAAAVDEARLWRRHMEMAKLGATPKGGVNRQALSAEDNAARKLLIAWARELGFEVSVDEAANLYVRRPGSDADAAPVMTGSHLDSQPTGGRFDGAYGVLGGLEALEAMERAGVRTRRPVEVVAWTNEEGSRFQPGCMGSSLFIGDTSLENRTHVVDRNGIRESDALKETLSALADIPRRKAGFPVAAYIEAHIEQGPRLESSGNTIGVVTGVQGMRYFAVEVLGEEAHAGTSPLKGRRDALKAAVSMIHALEQVMADPEDVVRFTVGRFEVHPCSPNVVPGRVFFTVDFRHPDDATVQRLTDQVEPVCRKHARGCTVTVTETSRKRPTTFDKGVVDALRAQADALGLSNMELPSGAGHDAMYLSRVCPAGMIFVPCERGVSHNEMESATPADLAAGTRVLAAALADLANR